ncbi:MAG: serine hydrolase domain-containing protein [Paracoccaceae bacterium]
MIEPNADLVVGASGMARWNEPDQRRRGFHNLHRIARYVQSWRAGTVLGLSDALDAGIAAREDVVRLTGSPCFSAMVVVRGEEVVFERYAADFGADCAHPIMSISKMVMMLEIGRLWQAGLVGLDEKVGDILPWAGAGYAGARLQDVLDMNVLNDYSEDYADPYCSVYAHEAAVGMRVPEVGDSRAFLAGVGLAAGAADTLNPTGVAMYRSANTDILAAVAEVRGERPTSAIYAEIADAAGVEGALHMITDRGGFAFANGGICMTARDLARYGLLIARAGVGVDGHEVGSEAFIERTLAGGVPMPAPRGHIRYSNQTNTNGRWIGHGGYGGQYMLVDMATGTVGVFMSVLENAAGYDAAYYPPIIAMLEAICGG